MRLCSRLRWYVRLLRDHTLCERVTTTFVKAFRPGIVDMTEDQLAVSRNAITLQPDGLDLDLMFPDLNL